MKNKLFIGLLLIALMLAFTSVINADNAYTFTLSEGANKTDDSEYWYMKLSAPQISGMADENEQAELNQYFLDYLDWIAEGYEEDKAYFLENYEGDEMPRFGYEYSYDMVTDSADYFVFKTALFYAAGSSMTVNEYWTLDKHSGKLAELSDFADEWRLTEIRSMIMDAMKLENENGADFWVEEEDNFDTSFSFAEEYHHWYVNEAGNLVFSFDKYEIAPGAMGESCFEITGDRAVLVKDGKYSFDLYAGDKFSVEEKNWFIDVTVPVVGGLADKTEEEEMNKHFVETAESVKNDFEKDVEFAKKSIAEGNDPHFGYQYNYEIMTDSDDYFAFKTSKFFVAASSSTSNEFWTLDKNTGKLLQWQDVVPEGAENSIHNKILAEMIKVNASGQGMYYTNDNSLQTALANIPGYHHWYLNADGQLVIVFDKYEVAVGVMGNPEFVIDLASL